MLHYSSSKMNYFLLLSIQGSLIYLADELWAETTMLPSTTQVSTTTYTPTPELHFFNKGPSSEFDAAGRKRFTGNVSMCACVDITLANPQRFFAIYFHLKMT